MKRSVFLKLVKKDLCEGMTDPEELMVVSETLEQILDSFEKYGMLPPPSNLNGGSEDTYEVNMWDNE